MTTAHPAREVTLGIEECRRLLALEDGGVLTVHGAEGPQAFLVSYSARPLTVELSTGVAGRLLAMGLGDVELSVTGVGPGGDRWEVQLRGDAHDVTDPLNLLGERLRQLAPNAGPAGPSRHTLAIHAEHVSGHVHPTAPERAPTPSAEVIDLRAVATASS